MSAARNHILLIRLLRRFARLIPCCVYIPLCFRCCPMPYNALCRLRALFDAARLSHTVISWLMLMLRVLMTIFSFRRRHYAFAAARQRCYARRIFIELQMLSPYMLLTPATRVRAPGQCCLRHDDAMLSAGRCSADTRALLLMLITLDMPLLLLLPPFAARHLPSPYARHRAQAKRYFFMPAHAM